jgi:hypothetical protein
LSVLLSGNERACVVNIKGLLVISMSFSG